MADTKCILCRLREVYRSIVEIETQLNEKYNLSMNEAMLLCCLSDKTQLTSTEISEALGLSCSNTSKVIKSVEEKKLIKRSLSAEDKRSMLFKLTARGTTKLAEMDICTKKLPDELRAFVNE